MPVERRRFGRRQPCSRDKRSCSTAISPFPPPKWASRTDCRWPTVSSTRRHYDTVRPSGPKTRISMAWMGSDFTKNGKAPGACPGPLPTEVTHMSARPILQEILQLPPDQRLQLVEDIWESLAMSPSDVPVPDWHRQLLDERLADPQEQPSRTWDEVQANARRPRRCRASGVPEVSAEGGAFRRAGPRDPC